MVVRDAGASTLGATYNSEFQSCTARICSQCRRGAWVRVVTGSFRMHSEDCQLVGVMDNCTLVYCSAVETDDII
jgi:hypothetical protein